MELVIFGVGDFYKKRINELYEIAPSVNVVAYVDNSLCGELINGKEIIHPSCICEISFDYILLMSASLNEMKKQLLNLGIDEEKIISWKKFLKIHGIGGPTIIGKKSRNTKGSVGIITCPIGYNGGSMAAVYLALALNQESYDACLITEDINKDLLDEIKNDIRITIYPNITLLECEELNYINEFDYIIVNTAQMANCAYHISKIKNTLWWIHEGERILIEKGYRQVDWRIRKKHLDAKVVAVSNIAKKEFNKVYRNVDVSILPIGVPDQFDKQEKIKNTDKLVFAVIGSIIKLKAQDDFLKAAQQIGSRNNNIEFWLIGKRFNDDNYNEIIDVLQNDIQGVKYLGELSRDEMKSVYQKIDVLVCPSLIESMSLTTIEAMINNKAVIVSDKTGISKYITIGKDGFVFKAGDIKDLEEKMQWMIDHAEKRRQMGARARELYESEFSIGILSKKIVKLLEGM